jgi:hypothetical protein
MKAIIVDFIEAKITGEVEVIDFPNRIDQIYYKTSLGCIPVAYLYRPEDRKYIKKCLEDFRRRRDSLRQYEHDTFQQMRKDYSLK